MIWLVSSVWIVDFLDCRLGNRELTSNRRFGGCTDVYDVSLFHHFNISRLIESRFEVNLGFIVACLPTLRPFLVLINSRLTTLRDLSFSRSGLRWRTIPTANQNSNRTTGSAYENIEFDTASRRSNANIIIKETTTQVEYGSQHSDLEAGSHIQDSWKPVG